MAASLFATALTASHRITRRLLTTSNDAQGRPLLLWWPAAEASNRRNVTEANSHTPRISAFMGPSRRDAAAAFGLTEIPKQTMTFACEASAFPSAVPPRAGICFNAGPTFAESTFYMVIRATSVAGVVEIEATTEP